MMNAIQYVETFAFRAGAEEALNWLRTQDGFIGGRILEPNPADVAWRVQAFFVDDDPAIDPKWLPDGCRYVLIPRQLARVLGIEEGQNK